MFFHIPDDNDSIKIKEQINGALPYKKYKYSDYYNEEKINEIVQSDSFVFCSTSMAKKLKDKGKSRIYTEGLNVSQYSRLLGKEFLNYSFDIYSVDWIKNNESKLPDFAFYKTDECDKMFAGNVLIPSEVIAELQYIPESVKFVIISPLKWIDSEYRLFVNCKSKEILSASRYKQINNTLSPQKRIPSSQFQDYINDLNLPDLPYVVVDVCILSEDKSVKVVELNPINCAGSYHCDMLAVCNDIYNNKDI